MEGALLLSARGQGWLQDHLRPLSDQAVWAQCRVVGNRGPVPLPTAEPRALPCPTFAFPGKGAPPRPWVQPGYLDGLGRGRPLLGTASGHVQEERFEAAWQGQLVVLGDPELGCHPQDRSHTVH